MRLPGRRMTYWLLALAATGLAWWLLRPAPLRVETGRVALGPLQVTVDEEGKTRSRDRFVVTAPLSGQLARIALRDGDVVSEGQRLAVSQPRPLAAREYGDQAPGVAAAEARQREAEEAERRAAQELARASSAHQRAERLREEGFLSAQAAEQAQREAAALRHALEGARAHARSAAAEVRIAQAGQTAPPAGAAARVEVRSPVSGRVLRIADASARVVTAGTPLMTLGDTGRLEVVVELLSSEAVRVAPGMPVILDNWGGDGNLQGRVERVEPYAFTKLSALGVDEQRTRVVVGLVKPPAGLGDGYRVDAHIVVWAAARVLQMPSSALFRCDDAWCVFLVDAGRAVRRQVMTGRGNAQQTEVRQGLQAGDTLVLHPDSQLEDGMRVTGG